MNFITIRRQLAQRFSKFFPQIITGQLNRIALSFKGKKVFMALNGKTCSVTEQISNVNLVGLKLQGPAIFTDFQYYKTQLKDKKILELSINQ